MAQRSSSNSAWSAEMLLWHPFIWSLRHHPSLLIDPWSIQETSIWHIGTWESSGDSLEAHLYSGSSRSSPFWLAILQFSDSRVASCTMSVGGICFPLKTNLFLAFQINHMIYEYMYLWVSDKPNYFVLQNIKSIFWYKDMFRKKHGRTKSSKWPRVVRP